MPYGYCGNPSVTSDSSNAESYIPNVEYCTNNYLKSTIYDDFNSQCAGKTGCDFTATSYVDIGTALDGYANNGTTICTTNPAKVYLQYKCKESDGALNSKREQGLLISSIACFAAIFFLIVVFYLKKTNDVDYQQWDLMNLTASDFTVEYFITEEMWNLFNVQLGSHSQLPAGGSSPSHIGEGLPVVTFEAFLEHYFTRKLNRCPKVIEDVEIRVANITFGFCN